MRVHGLARVLAAFPVVLPELWLHSIRVRPWLAAVEAWTPSLAPCSPSSAFSWPLPRGRRKYEAMFSFGASSWELGAVDIIVPGALPVGCFAVYLTVIPSPNPADYDEYGCLKPLNALSIYQNALLRHRLAELQARYGSSARIMYADYYAHVEQMVHDPARFGFSSGAMTACCGAGGGRYNYEFDTRCGMKGATPCADRPSHESSDGVHLTEAVNRLVADGWLRGPYCHPPILQ